MFIKTFLTAAAVALLLPAASLAQNGSIPANKTAVVGSGAIVWEGSVDGVETSVHTLLTETVRTPGNGSLVMHFAAECFIGSYDIDSSIPYSPLSALDGRLAGVRVWIEVDGEPLPGRVNFCGHGLFQLQFDPANLFEVELEAFGGTYAFNWAALGLSNGIHTIEVKARLIAAVLSIDGFLDEGVVAVIGKRGLIIDPVKVRLDETLGNDSPPS